MMKSETAEQFNTRAGVTTATTHGRAKQIQAIEAEAFQRGKKQGIRDVAQWINKHRYSPISGWHLVTLDIQAFERGEIPYGENK